MKSLLALLLLFAVSLPAATEAPAKKKEAATEKAAKNEPSEKAVATAKTLTPSQKSKLLELLNKGDETALQTLPGIGAARAKNIVKARPFADPVDLVKINGIGDATLEDIVAHAKAGFPEKSPKKAAPAKKKTGAADKKAAKE